MKLRLFVLINLVLVSDLITASPIDALIAERLGYMKDVALYKSQHGLPIEDLPREQIVLDNAVRHGLRFGLKPDSSRQFFSLQIEAAKEIQAYWLQRWQAYPAQKPDHVPDLVNVIRPGLIELGNRITAILAQDTRQSPDIVAIEGLSADTARRIASATTGIEKYADRLRQIIDSGRLRVGTTGDYEPFSH